MEYTVIENVNTDEFIEAVNERLKQGWELYGNLVVTSYKQDETSEPLILYAQPMIKGGTSN